MNIKLILLTVATMLFTNVKVQSQTDPKVRKALVVYFSRSGNTQTIANQIKEETGADIIRIEPVTPYPEEYKAVVDQAKKEINAGYRPAIKNNVKNMETYDIIFVGSPNWWGTIAPPVATFLSTYNLSGKTIAPFITHEGSRMGDASSDIGKLCPQSTVLEGLPIRGGSVDRAHDEVKRWLKEINIIQ